MRCLLAVVAAALVTGRAEALDEWTWRDTAWELSFVAAFALDTAQTDWAMQRPGDWTETNPILGRHPSAAKLNTWLIAGSALHAGVSYLLPAKWRRGWQCVSLIAETGSVVRNRRLGAGLAFSF